MIISLALVLLVTAGGTLLTYLYDEGPAFAARLCAGACIGITTLGLIGFIFASFLGLTPLAILLTAAVHCLSFMSLRDPNRRAMVEHHFPDRPSRAIASGPDTARGYEFLRGGGGDSVAGFRARDDRSS